MTPINTNEVLYLIERAKREWEAAVDALPQIICLLDQNGLIARANRTVETWGLSTVKEVKGKSLHELLHPNCTNPSCYLSALWQSYVDDSDGVSVEVNDPVLNRYLQIQIEPVKNKEGARIELIDFATVHISDITRKKQVESLLGWHIDNLSSLLHIQRELANSLDASRVLNIGFEAALRLSMAARGCIVTLEENDELDFAYIKNLTEKDTANDSQIQLLVKQVLQSQEPIIYRVANTSENQTILSIDQSIVLSAHIVLPLISRGQALGALYLEATHGEEFSDDVIETIVLLESSIAISLDNARLYQLSEERLKTVQSLYRDVSDMAQLKTDMIRLAAHDLRNPITTLMMHTEMLKRMGADNLDERQLRIVDVIHNTSARMADFVRDLLSLERIEEMHRDQSAKVDLTEMVHQVVAEQVDRAQIKDIMLHTDADLEAPHVFVNGTDFMLSLALTNLVSNAIKYTDSGGSVNVRIMSKENKLQIEVEDNGYGIPEEDQAQLFEPFFRAKLPETSHISGTGLGLHLVRNIIERHRGEVFVRSVRGQGSTFGFILPRADN
ncbi:MAG: GAF domain-containing protein [Anaerolineae bacterium]|nr:GAF domain-containing protein [Anaerolineae bacterium]MCA9892277.1 GAF domain-containing protein [Anaerolineae bacterium]